jgi:hypothetical protein
VGGWGGGGGGGGGGKGISIELYFATRVGFVPEPLGSLFLNKKSSTDLTQTSFFKLQQRPCYIKGSASDICMF